MVGKPQKASAPHVARISGTMIHLFINALSASAGGGLTYIRNVVPELARRNDVYATVLVSSALRNEIGESNRTSVVKDLFNGGAGSRFWHEQRVLPSLVRRSGANVLLCPGNFALFRSPIPQILLSRNALYTSADFLRDVRERGDYRLWIDTKIKGALARWSVLRADCAIAPSEAFAEELRRWTRKKVECIHHGFDPESFFRNPAPLPQEMRQRLESAAGAVNVLFVSHYNYYRNFETLIRAIALLKQKLYPRKVRLILTCKLISQENPGSYRAETAAELVRSLQLEEEVIQLGAVPYAQLHHIYKSCDCYVTPAYAETFAHPLMEAMASGLPTIASDLPVHHEICTEAAVYFPRFSADALAERIIQLSACETRRTQMREMGLNRSQDFRWSTHVDALLRLARHLVKVST
jgi:glycosyltransferase involved in cell wall biosynthesis